MDRVSSSLIPVSGPDPILTTPQKEAADTAACCRDVRYEHQLLTDQTTDNKPPPIESPLHAHVN